MPVLLRRTTAVPAAPWRNGRGTTWELIGEDHAVALTPGRPWRLSVALLVAAGEFSVFPRRERVLMPWGCDITLQIDDARRVVPHGTTVHFSGEARTRLLTVAAPCHAINLMARDGEPDLAPIAVGTPLADGGIVVITEAAPDLDLFDVVRLHPGEPMPSAGVLVRLPSDGVHHPGPARPPGSARKLGPCRDCRPTPPPTSGCP